MPKSLPENFRIRFRNMLGDEELAKYEECLQLPMEHGLRVNTLRMTPEEFRKIAPWKHLSKTGEEMGLSPVPWCKSGFYLDDHSRVKAEPDQGVSAAAPSRHPLYYAGAYYLQEPSAMLPAAALPVSPGDRVLDLCAAPGGKSTALAEKLRGRGLLVSNDISASRAKALIKNLELFGVENAVVTAETPKRLASHFPDYFDKILIDAPCSGEGMFRKTSAMITDWTEEKTREYALLQREIAGYAIRMLKPGGMLLYSTCTYAPEEDEGTVLYLLNLPEAKEKGLRLKPIPASPGFLPGNAGWLKEAPDDTSILLNEADMLHYTMHLYPHRLRGEGHFAALFGSGPLAEDEIPQDVNTESYGESAEGFRENRKPMDISSIRKKYPEFYEFASMIRKDWDISRMKLSQGYLSLLPDAVGTERELAGLRVLRSGLFLGEIRKNRFEPSQALAMTLTPESFSNTLNLSLGDDRVLRYLKGETLEIRGPEVQDGWALVAVEGLPLGFGKAKCGSMKNKLLPGWRMN